MPLDRRKLVTGPSGAKGAWRNGTGQSAVLAAAAFSLFSSSRVLS
jgi:hypothetical protein